MSAIAGAAREPPRARSPAACSRRSSSLPPRTRAGLRPAPDERSAAMERRVLLCLAVPADRSPRRRPARTSTGKKRGSTSASRPLQSKIEHARSQRGRADAARSRSSTQDQRSSRTTSARTEAANTLERQLAASQQRLNRVTELFALQTKQLVQLRRDYGDRARTSAAPPDRRRTSRRTSTRSTSCSPRRA